MEVATSIAGLLAVGAQISSILQKFITSYTNAPAIAKSIQDEIKEFNFTLSQLQYIVFGSVSLDQSRALLIDVNHLSSILTGCVCTFSGIEKEFSRLKVHGKLGVWDRIKWSRTEQTISQLIQRVESHNLSLNLILTIFKSKSSVEAENCQSSLQEQLSMGIPGMPDQAQSGAGSLPGSYPETTNLNLTTDDSGLVSGDDSDSVMAATKPRRIDIYPLTFEPTLFVSRPYKGVSTESVISLATSKRPRGRWSLYTRGSNTSVFSLPTSISEIPGVSLTHVSGVSLAELPSISKLSLPIPWNELYNPMWYNNNTTDPLLPLFLTTSEARVLGVSTLQEIPQFPLHSAATNGLNRIVNILLDGDVDIEERNGSGNTPLHLAAWKGQEMTVQLLLGRGAQTEGKNRGEYTPLHLATRSGHRATVQTLLEGGAGIQANDGHGNTTLHLAVSAGYEVMTDFLLSKGAYINAYSTSWDTPLHLAASAGYEAMTDLLLSRGAYINACNTNWDTPLHLAVENRHDGVVKLLLKWGLKVDIENRSGAEDLCKAKNLDGDTPLDLAKDHDIVTTIILRNHGADMNAMGKDGDTPLHSMITVQPLARWTIEKAETDGNTKLHLAARNGNPKLALFLLNLGADNRAINGNGDTPLHLGAANGHTAVVQLLLDRGADMEAKDMSGYTPLHLAAINRHDTVVKLLLKQCNADEAKVQHLINLCADKWAKKRDTSLHFAAGNGQEWVVEFLLSQGVDIEKRDKDGYTPLHLAARSGHKAIVKLLLEGGADKDTKGSYSKSMRTPIELAAWNRHDGVVTLLKNWEASTGNQI